MPSLIPANSPAVENFEKEIDEFVKTGLVFLISTRLEFQMKFLCVLLICIS